MCKKLLLIFLILPSLIKAQDIDKNADSLLSSYYRQGVFSGNVAIFRKGKPLFVKSYGYSDFSKQIPNNIATEFRIGSISKTFIAGLIMRMAEQRKLSIDDRLSKFLPDYRFADSITIKNLLNHTSGIASFTSSPKFQQEKMKMTKSQQVIDVIRDAPLLFHPGEKFNYSNSNYLLLGLIAEKVSGMTLESLLKREITQPFKMKNSGLDDDIRISTNKAVGYEAALHNDFKAIAPNNIGILGGAGAMFSNVPDLLRWDRAMYEGPFLNDSTKAQMYQPNLKSYGLGWLVNKIGRLSYSHSGSIDGFKSNIQRFPESETVIIFLSNYFNTPGPEICSALEAIAFNEPFSMPAERNFTTLSESDLMPYTGSYLFKGNMKMVIAFENGRLVSKIDGQPTVSLKPFAKDSFYVPMNDAEIHFMPMPAGGIGSLQIRMGKQTIEFAKDK